MPPTSRLHANTATNTVIGEAAFPLARRRRIERTFSAVATDAPGIAFGRFAVVSLAALHPTRGRWFDYAPAGISTDVDDHKSGQRKFASGTLPLR